MTFVPTQLNAASPHMIVMGAPPEETFLQRFLARIPSATAATFTAEQLKAIQQAFGMRYTVGHAVDLRRSVRLPWGNYYVVLLAGRDRNKARGRPVPRLLLAVATVFLTLACAGGMLGP